MRSADSSQPHWSKVWQDGLEKALSKGDDPLEQLGSIINFLVSISDKHSEVGHLFYRETGHLTEHGRELAKNFEREMVDRTASACAANVAETVLQGWATPFGRKAWERRTP